MSEASDLRMMIASKVPIIVVESHDEARVLSLVAEIGMRKGMGVMEWTAVRGMERGAVQRGPVPAEPQATDPEEALLEVARTNGPVLFAFCDLHPWLKEPRIVRLLKEIALDHERSQNTLVLVSHRLEIPEELSRLSARFRMSLPDRDTLLGIVREQAEEWAKRNRGGRVRTDRATLDALIDNLSGVTEADARVLIRNAIQNDGAITDSDIPEINRLKFSLLDSGSVLHFEYDVPDLSAVAGLDNLKGWLGTRRGALRGMAGADDLDRPKGLLLLGVQGGGKSLAARAIAGETGLPLLRLDFANLYNKYIGETERNLREALAQAERMAPCVLWMDEIEKGTDTSGADNGPARRLLGTLLTWMSEHTARVFVVATANDISRLPPELMRKGRIDEIFFVDLPGAAARRDILELHLRKRGCEVDAIELDLLATLSDGFTGAELEQAVVSARYRVRAEAGSGAAGRVDTHALRHAIESTVPLSVTMAEEVAALRAWARERCVPADAASAG